MPDRSAHVAWMQGFVSDYIRSAEIRDKRAWAEMTFPGARLGRKRQPNDESRREIQRLKRLFPLKVLKQNVKECELRDYRVKAKRLLPKGEYFGMRNYYRFLSNSKNFGQFYGNSYPEKQEMPSLKEMVDVLDGYVDESVFEDLPLLSARSEPGQRTKSVSDVRSGKYKTTDDIDVHSTKLNSHRRNKSLVEYGSLCK